MIAPDNRVVRGFREATRLVYTSRGTAFAVSALGVGLGVLGLFRDPLAGAIIIGAVFLSFCVVGVYGLILRDRFGGLYQIVNDEDSWEIKDKTGTDVLLTKVRTVRFLQDGVFAIRDYAWGLGVGKGQPLADDDYRCVPGHRVDEFTADGRHNVVISLREAKHRGDIQTFTIMRRFRDAFTAPSEFVQAEIIHETQNLTMTVIFPADRLPTDGPWLSLRSKSDDREKLAMQALPDKRQKVSQTLSNPRRGEMYTISWNW